MTSAGQGTFYDGQSARPKSVVVSLDMPDNVTLSEQSGAVVASWSRDDIRMADAPVGTLRVHRHPDDGARLEVSDAMFSQALMQACPYLRNNDALNRSMGFKIVGWSMAACVSLVLLAVYGVPAIAERVVPFIPHAVDKQIGASVKTSLIKQLAGGNSCKPKPVASRAFNSLTKRLMENARDLPNGVEITIIPSSQKNAFALPGGQIIVLSGLLDSAETPDEFAGVIAHELGHVAGRHSMHKLASESALYFLLGVVLGDFSGGTVIIAGSRAILSAGYSRDAERDADTYALALMDRSDGDPASLATILDRISSGGLSGVLGLLASHPLPKERAAEIQTMSARLSGGKKRGGLLGLEQWQALKSYCTDKTKAGEPSVPAE